MVQCLEAEGLLLLAPELASRAEGFGESVIGQIHRQVMAHAEVGDHWFEDRLGFPLEALPIRYSCFTRPTNIPIPLGWAGVLKPEGAVVRAGGLKQPKYQVCGSPLA